MNAHHCVVDCWCRTYRPWALSRMEQLLPVVAENWQVFNRFAFGPYVTSMALTDGVEEFDASCNPAGWPVEQ